MNNMLPSEALIKGRKLAPKWTNGVLFDIIDDDTVHACALGAMWVGYYGSLPTWDDIKEMDNEYWWNDWKMISVNYPCIDLHLNEKLAKDLSGSRNKITTVIAHLSDDHNDTFGEDKIVEWLKGMGL